MGWWQGVGACNILASKGQKVSPSFSLPADPVFPGEGGEPCSLQMGGTHGACGSASSPRECRPPVHPPSQRLGLDPGHISPPGPPGLISSPGGQCGLGLTFSPNGKNLGAGGSHIQPALDTLLANSARGTS